MASPLKKPAPRKEKEVVPNATAKTDSLRVYFGRTPGIPAVRVVRAANEAAGKASPSEESPAT